MPDNKYVLSVDNGVDQVKIYRFNDKEQKMVQVDAIRCDPGICAQTFPVQQGRTLPLSDVRA